MSTFRMFALAALTMLTRCRRPPTSSRLLRFAERHDLALTAMNANMKTTTTVDVLELLEAPLPKVP